jgi:hypothetical protein
MSRACHAPRDFATHLSGSRLRAPPMPKRSLSVSRCLSWKAPSRFSRIYICSMLQSQLGRFFCRSGRAALLFDCRERCCRERCFLVLSLCCGTPSAPATSAFARCCAFRCRRSFSCASYWNLFVTTHWQSMNVHGIVDAEKPGVG